MPSVWIETGTALALGYLLGSIPFGLLLARFGGAGDIREVGSGNIGATNVLRTGRKGLAAATLLLDLLKGTVAVLLAAHFFRGLKSLPQVPPFSGIFTRYGWVSKAGRALRPMRAFCSG